MHPVLNMHFELQRQFYRKCGQIHGNTIYRQYFGAGALLITDVITRNSDNKSIMIQNETFDDIQSHNICQDIHGGTAFDGLLFSSIAHSTMKYSIKKLIAKCYFYRSAISCSRRMEEMKLKVIVFCRV